ncbi:unnamed protein product [Rotaria sordida]|uniref:BZIP domain-containing protein n=2 Tax=Rotaria sordida TaxID=392033 RepID=A0A814K1J5_9BILA|nr:unnamed protein product [Rotaria sordida]
MRSFFIGLFFLLIVSYWAHIFLTREIHTNELATVIIDNSPIDNGICECRCCLLSGTMCETIIRYSISFKKNFSCDLCTNEYCTMNINETEQCEWMHTMKANCYQYESRQKSLSSFVNLLSFLFVYKAHIFKSIKMMMETVCDPYDILFGDPKSPTSNGLLFTNEVTLSDFNNDPLSISPILNTIDNAEYSEDQFDPVAFDAFLNDFLSSEPSLFIEQSIDLPLTSFESEPTTREIGTDPMEPVPTTRPITITTTNINQLTKTPIILIQTSNKTANGNSLRIESVPWTTTVPTEIYNLQFDPSSSTINDYPMEDILPLTPSTSSESPDETSSNSPDSSDNAYSKMLTNFDNLPSTGPLVLTNEELKLIKQEGYQVPTKLPLNKTEEKILKKIRRKIKNKISAQESRRKKKEYVDALEKQITKYVDENNALKERMATIEKDQKKLAQERDLLRSMINKGLPGPSTALMVFAVFFAVVFGIWAPVTNKSLNEDRSLSLENALLPSSNYQSAFTSSRKSLLEQQESTHSNYVTDNYKSRVLLSIDEHDNHHHHHGPYLPSKNKYQSTFQQQTAAPGYTYPNTVEKYMNKKLNSEQFIEKIHNDNYNLKRSFIDESSSMVHAQEPTYKKIRSNYHVNENFVVIEETNGEKDNVLNESKPVKIIRVERTIPAIGNDTLKLAQHRVNK